MPIDPASSKEAVTHHALGKQKKRWTAKTTTTRNFPIPNTGGFRSAGTVVFKSVVIRAISALQVLTDKDFTESAATRPAMFRSGVLR